MNSVPTSRSLRNAPAANAPPCRWALGVVAILVLGQLALADTLKKKNGTVLQGRIISETEAQVVFEWTQFGKCIVTVPRGDIVELVKGEYDASLTSVPKPKPTTGTGDDKGADKPKKPTDKPAGKVLRFCYIPVVGEIGVEVNAADFDTVVRNVRTYQAETLVLYIDSPGGSTSEAQSILAKLATLKGIKLVALVKRAHSTAAAIALACPEIYVTDDATIGDVTPFQGRKATKPAAFPSAAAAAFRMAAQNAKHSPLILKGMMNKDVELSIPPGKTAVVQGAGGKSLTKKGGVMTLTSAEAVQCGLARKTAANLEALKKTLGADRSWYMAWAGGSAFMKSRAVKNRLAFRQAEYRESIAPQLTALDSQLKNMEDEAGRILAESKRLKNAYTDERQDILKDYDRRIRNAEEQYYRDLPDSRLKVSAPDYYYRESRDARRDRDRRFDDAQDERDRSLRKLDTKYKGQFDEVDTRYKRLDQDARKVRASKKKLLDAGPK